MNPPVKSSETGDWVTDSAPDRDVVVSSRVRFARNLMEHTFPEKASPDEQESVRETIRQVVSQEEDEDDWRLIDVEELTDVERQLLCERRLASEDLMSNPYGGLFFRTDENLGLMVNEEDHLRIQALEAGGRINSAFQRATEFERQMDDELDFAFDDDWGYLSACPTNLGTGLRASVLLHLPGLVLVQKINKVLKAVSNLGLTVRGFEGEGSESKGFYFQLSNQVTMGQSADELKQTIQRVTGQIVEQERAAREGILNKASLDIEDRIWRSYGALNHARKISSDESLQRISFYRLGVDVGELPECPLSLLDGLLLLTQPAHLVHSLGEDLSSDQRDFYRARRIRERLNSVEDDEGTT
ncbi:MAG: ATP--guanido phosphotransferase [bacterium]